MTYAFVHHLSYADTVRETSIDISEDGTHLLATSIETVSDYRNYCRELSYQVGCVMNLFLKKVVQEKLMRASLVKDKVMKVITLRASGSLEE